MQREFPHLDGANSFPHLDTVGAFRYANDFDYSRWAPDTRLAICSVPWCGDYENVVKFDGDEARDAYLDGIAGPREVLATAVHVKPDGTVKLPYPVSVMQRCNYLVVDLPTPTSDAQPILYADMPRKRRYLYFIDDVSQAAPNTSLCTVRLDIWSTYINDLSFDYIMLDRGHAPMAATSVSEYLGDPLSRSRYLLAPDADFGRDRPRVGANRPIVYNTGEMRAVICTYADPRADFSGSTPAQSMSYTQGVPAAFAFCVRVSDLDALMSAIDSQAPNFKQCVQALFLASADMLDIGASFQLAGISCNAVEGKRKREGLFDFEPGQFGYPEPYDKIAKLYTYPYACAQLADSDGSVRTVRIEDTTGSISIDSALSIVAPWISIDSHLIGIGGVERSTAFSNTSSNNFAYTGFDAQTFKRWDVPTFRVWQSGARETDWSHRFDRAQAQTAASNALASAQASNATAQANADNSASNIAANNAVAVAANNALTAQANATASQGTGYTNANTSANTSQDNFMTSQSYQAEQAGLAVAATNNNAQASAGAVGAITGVIASAATGDIGGAISSGLGALNTATSWACANASNAVSQSNSALIYNATISANNAKMNNNVEYNNAATNSQNDQRSANNSINNNASTSIAGNNASLTRTNAANTRKTADANAQRAYDTAMSAISNARAQQGMRAPQLYGEHAHGETAVTRPLGTIAQIVTEPIGAIMSAGDQMMRFGYNLGQQWRMESMQVMRYFTYWQASEVWCAGEGGALESAQQTVRDIFARGVTVWSDPEKIGKVSIYDNL